MHPPWFQEDHLDDLKIPVNKLANVQKEICKNIPRRHQGTVLLLHYVKHIKCNDITKGDWRAPRRPDGMPDGSSSSEEQMKIDYDMHDCNQMRALKPKPDKKFYLGYDLYAKDNPHFHDEAR